MHGLRVTCRVTSDSGFYYYNASRKRAFVSCLPPACPDFLHFSVPCTYIYILYVPRYRWVVLTNDLPERKTVFRFTPNNRRGTAKHGWGGNKRKTFLNQSRINNLHVLMNKCSRCTAKGPLHSRCTKWPVQRCIALRTKVGRCPRLLSCT